MLLRALRKETGLSHRDKVLPLLRMNPCLFFESFENRGKPDVPGSNAGEAHTKIKMKTKESKSTKRHSSRDKAREERDSKSASESTAPVAPQSCVPEIWKAVMCFWHRYLMVATVFLATATAAAAVAVAPAVWLAPGQGGLPKDMRCY